MKTFTRRQALRSLSLGTAGMLYGSQLFANYSSPTNYAQISSKNMPEDAMDAVRTLAIHGISAFAFTPKGGWVVVGKNSDFLHKGIPSACKAKLDAFLSSGHTIKCIAFPPKGSSSFVIITDKDHAYNQIGGSLTKELASLKSKGKKIKHIAFRPKRSNDRWILVTEEGFIAQNIQDDCYQMLSNLQESPIPNSAPTRKTHHVTFSNNGGWVVNADDYFQTRKIPDVCLRKMKDFKGQYMYIDLVVFHNQGWCIISNQSMSEQPTDAIRDFEKNVRGGGIWKRMELSKVPGVSVASIVDNKLAWSCGYGFLKTGDVHAIHRDSIFQAGSLSQLVSTIGALRLAQEGKVGLDDDLRIPRYNFNVPVSADFEIAEGQEPTLNLILANRCGFNVKGLKGYGYGRKIPNIDQILNGIGGANNPKVEILKAPNTEYAPSAGGFIVLDKLIGTVANQSAAKWLNQNVLSALSMKNSTFNLQSNPKHIAAHNVAAGHNPNGGVFTGERYSYPESSAYGLQTNVRDIANVVSMINQGGKFNGQTYLSTSLVEKLLTPVNELEKRTRGLGLSITNFEEVNDEGTNFRYSKAGQCMGFRSFVMGYPIQGTGVVVMANGNAKDGPRFCFDLAMSVAKTYGWE